MYEGQRCNYRQVWLIKERYSHIKLRYSTALFFDLTKNKIPHDRKLLKPITDDQLKKFNRKDLKDFKKIMNSENISDNLFITVVLPMAIPPVTHIVCILLPLSISK